MKKYLLSTLKISIFLGFGVFLIWLVFENLSPEDRAEIHNAFYGANYFWVLVSVIAALASHISRAVRWKMLLAPMGYKPSTINSFFAVMVGYLANMAVPRLGEVTRCGILNRYENIPINKSVGTVVTERALDLIFLFLLFVFVFITQFGRLGIYAQNFIIDPFKEKFLSSVSQGAILIVVGMVVVGLIATIYFLKERIKQIPLLKKSIDVIRGFAEGLKSIKGVRNPVLFIAHSVFIWTMYLLMLYSCFFCLEQTSSLGLNAALSVLAFGSLAMIATPGGIGAYPPVVRGILGLYGVDPNIGLAFGWIAWGGQTLLVLIVGFISLLLLSVVNRSSHELQTSYPIEDTGQQPVKE